MTFDRDKFRALVLYVIWRAGQQEGFGATKLNKVLWFAEARHFMAYGAPITGETYIRHRHGPVPSHINEIKADLVSSGEIEVFHEEYFGNKIERFVTDLPPNVESFTSQELSLVDWWIRHVSEEHTATSISDLSHNYTWKIAAMGEPIPLYAVFATRIRAPMGEELDWAKAEAKRLGLI